MTYEDGGRIVGSSRQETVVSTPPVVTPTGMTPAATTSTVTEERGVRRDSGRVTAYKSANIVWLLVGLVDGLLLIRFVLKLLAANPDAGFSQFIYNITSPLVAPFLLVFREPAAGGSVMELGTLLGLIVYALVGWAIVKAIDVMAT